MFILYKASHCYINSLRLTEDVGDICDCRVFVRLALDKWGRVCKQICLADSCRSGNDRLLPFVTSDIEVDRNSWHTELYDSRVMKQGYEGAPHCIQRNLPQQTIECRRRASYRAPVPINGFLQHANYLPHVPAIHEHDSLALATT